jgi:acylphosphatase
MAASYRFTVLGRVQGVGFRAATQRKAAFLGLRGWVRNREDGAVEGLCAGTEDDIVEFRKWLEHGPPTARVDRLDWRPADESADEDFRVRR